MSSELERLTLRELEIFGDLARMCSIREVSRWREMEVGQVSRILKRLETRLQMELFKRSHRGLVLTPEGQHLRSIVENTLDQLKSLGQVQLESEKDTGIELGPIGAPSFLATGLIGPMLGKLYQSKRIKETELCEVVPDRIVLSGLRGIIDIAFHAGHLDWSRSWSTHKIGTASWRLFCNAQFFKDKASEFKIEDILSMPFIYPTYWSPEGLRTGNDRFPVSLRRRKKAFGVSTIQLALLSILECEAVSFLPDLAVYPAYTNQIIPLDIEGIEAVTEDIFVSVHEDRVSKKALDMLIEESSLYLQEKPKPLDI